MSTFPGPLEEIPHVSVDRFDGKNLLSEVFFLSHFHSDHMVGLKTPEFHAVLKKKESAFLFCSEITALFVSSNHLKGLDAKIRILPINKEHILSVKGLDGCVKVTALSAGHCPGSVMFLFNYKGLNYLYTGDFRMTKQNILDIKALREPEGGLKPIQTLYLDTTFFDQKYSYLPSRDESMSKLIKECRSWLEKSNDTVIDLRTPAIVGVEYVLITLSQALGQPIHVSNDTYARYTKIPDILSATTMDEKSRIHACIAGHCGNGSPTFLKYHVGVKYHNILTIKLCCLHATDFSDEKIFIYFEKHQLHRLVYSSHSSHSELMDMIQTLLPKKIVPCVVPPKNTMEQVLQSLESSMNHLRQGSSSGDSEILQFSSFEEDVERVSALKKTKENKSLPVSNGEALLTLSKYNVTESSDEEGYWGIESEEEDELPPFRWDCFYDGRKSLGFPKNDSSPHKRQKFDML